MYKLHYHKRTEKQKQNLKSANLLKKAKALVDLIERDPYKTPPKFKQLDYDLKGYYSRRINRQHRLVYTVDEEKKEVRIHSMWSHYEF